MEKTTEVAETPEQVAIEGDEDGNGKLSEFEKQILSKSNYVLLDGTTVKAPKPGETVNPAIIENIKAVAAPAVDGLTNSGTTFESGEAFYKVIEAEQQRIARKIVMVNQAYNGDCGCVQWQVWTLDGAVIEPTSSFDTAGAAANEYAARAAKYEVIVFD